MTRGNKLPDFVKPGARVRISYEGLVTAINEWGGFPSMVRRAADLHEGA